MTRLSTSPMNSTSLPDCASSLTSHQPRRNHANPTNEFLHFSWLRRPTFKRSANVNKALMLSPLSRPNSPFLFGFVVTHCFVFSHLRVRQSSSPPARPAPHPPDDLRGTVVNGPDDVGDQQLSHLAAAIPDPSAWRAAQPSWHEAGGLRVMGRLGRRQQVRQPPFASQGSDACKKASVDGPRWLCFCVDRVYHVH